MKNLKYQKKGQIFLIGAETQFHIMDVNHNSQIQQNCDQQDFINFLLTEKKENNAVIHGLTPEEKQQFDILYNQFNNERKQQDNDTLGLEYRMNLRPYVKIKISSTQNPHIFTYNEQNPNQQFKIGRSQECAVQININTISRKQSRVVYESQKWQLRDGDIHKESANGTWVSLNDFRERNQSKQESDPKEIENGSEIKISDSILKIEIFNNSPQKNKYIYDPDLDKDQMDIEKNLDIKQQIL
ncbi:hypothetical protein IMG5_201620 [Ichthyophthirius multifiliis]|uniref:FHA domain-containing protein n=1 Tax=Ichthyophthirius multifiliis TaxID=5932 RepID=G0R5W0_ICHMU|nr:hypothetical protein IMG5_201620 [Ichthyophthirius multifiliis]EGR27137.1 hypothetical protein IMG5_201620 [Ichthyophthirius multifiliis]|eukprot:XP_004024021.1 hypothetical protein IMG5_201620 [Ichthyophthirius multifiliis]